MIDRRTALAACVCALALATPSGAWGPVGHKAVGMIAQKRLSPQALAAVRAILGEGVTLDQIANCADAFVFHDGDGTCAGAFRMEGSPDPTKPWHYIDIPVTEAAHPSASAMTAYCKGGDCAVAQIRNDVASLKDPAEPLIKKQMALMFLVHFVGDVHQPLHGADDVPSDYGGNKKLMSAILLRGKPVNLHSLWDGAIDSPEQVDYRLPDAVLTRKAESLASAEIGDDEARRWAAPADGYDLASQAAEESFDIAKAVIYPEYKATQGGDSLTRYQELMQATAQQRVRIAGVRLAALLEYALVADSQKSLGAPGRPIIDLPTPAAAADALEKR